MLRLFSRTQWCQSDAVRCGLNHRIVRSFEGKQRRLPQRGSAWCAEGVGSRRVIASHVNADLQPSTTDELCGVAQVLSVSKCPLLCSTPTRCVSPQASVSWHSACVEVDKKWGFERRRGGMARCLAIPAKGVRIDAEARRRGALAERRCSVAWALRRWTGKGDQDDLGGLPRLLAH